VVLKVVGGDVLGRDMSRISCEIVCKAVDGQAGANLKGCRSPAINGHKAIQTAVNRIFFFAKLNGRISEF
jgi:hypothetical protein